MRKIEQNMLAAIRDLRDWQEGNTTVEVAQHVGNPYCAATVYLHGNLIAEVDRDGGIQPNDKTFEQWPTATTASRLRALGINAWIMKGRAVIAED